MKFYITSTSGAHKQEELEFTTVEQLMKWIDKINEPVIIFHKNFNNQQHELEIYDDYRE